MLLTALIFGFVCFLGTNFYTLGNTTPSLILAAFITLLLSGTALGAKLLKRTSRNFKTCFIWEIILLVLFTGLMALFSYSPFPHYFVVSRQKTEIQSKLTASITQAEKMFANYERYAEKREALYKRKLRNVVAAKSINPSEYAKYGFEDNGIANSKQIENKLFILHAELFPTHYSNTISGDGIKEIATTWLSAAKNKLAGWKPIGVDIVDIVNEVEQNSTNWLNILMGFSTVREKGEQVKDFAYKLSFGDVKTHFTTLDQPTLLSICLAVIAYLLMLLPWIVTRRHSRFPGIKIIFGSGESSINEL
jgi:Tfp pilus assembly protein PilE